MIGNEKIDYEIKLIDPSEHRDELYNLCREVFALEANIDQFIWKYEQNPMEKMMVWSAWTKQDNQLIAVFSAFQRHFIYNGEIVTVYQQADGIVKSEYRGQGIFRNLVNDMNSYMYRNKTGVFLLFGYPNRLSAHVMRKSDNARELYLSNVFVFINGFKNVGSTLLKSSNIIVSTLDLIFTPLIRFLNTIKGYNRESDVTLVPVKEFNDLPYKWSFDWAKDHIVFPLREKKFLSWKAIEVPEVIKKDLFTFWCVKKNQKIGYCILYRDINRNILKLLDFLCENDLEILVECLKSIRHFAISNKYDAITTNVASEYYKRALAMADFKKSKEVRSIISLINADFTDQEIFNQSFWLQMPIDRDDFFY
jgi:hypothetical protein